jgi:hypothetical protein
MQDSKVANSDGWYVYNSSDENGLFSPEDWEFSEKYPLVAAEQKVILSMLKLFVKGDYGHYFSEIHETDEPSDLPTQWDENGEKKDKEIWKTVYDTPAAYYYKSYEYNIIKTHRTKEFTYYAISLHGSSLASALTEYVRIRND